jgi:hypothetical protein
MSDRVVRDELLTSERYWSVSIQAQQLYIHLLLCVDDAARFSGKNFTIRSACFPGRVVEAQELERILSELIDVDLVRAYMVGCDRFLFVPRFRNRRRYVASSKFPQPPNEINDLVCEKTDSSHPQVIPKSSPSQEERGRRGVGVGEKTRDSGASPSAKLPPPSFAGDVNLETIQPRAIVALSPDWELPQAWGVDAERLGWPGGAILKEAEKFRQYWVSGKGAGKRRTVKGWRQSWSNWIAKAGAYA